MADHTHTLLLCTCWSRLSHSYGGGECAGWSWSSMNHWRSRSFCTFTATTRMTHPGPTFTQQLCVIRDGGPTGCTLLIFTGTGTNMVHVQSTHVYISSSGTGTSHPVPETKSSLAECCSAIHRSFCILSMNTKLPLNSCWIAGHIHWLGWYDITQLQSASTLPNFYSELCMRSSLYRSRQAGR